MRPFSRKGSLSLVWRSFFLQSAWNVERMQNVGFLFSLLPALRRIYSGDPEKLARACRRHLELFNSHPYLAGPILGAVAHMEAECREGALPLETLLDFKKGTMTAFAAMGDALFWGVLKPMGAAVALVFVLSGHWWGPLVFLAAYNGIHLAVRCYGLDMAYRHGMRVLPLVQAWDIPGRVIGLRRWMPLLLGFVAAKCVAVSGDDVRSVLLWSGFPVVCFSYFLIRKRVAVPLILGGLFVLVLGGNLLFALR